jgi:uncharacterized protein
MTGRLASAGIAADGVYPEMTGIRLAGIDLQLDHHGGLIWRDENMLVVSDLHLEKGSAYALRGQMLPPYDSAVTLAALTRLMLRHRPARLLLLGDSFHDIGGYARMNRDIADSLLTLTQMVETIWITGNHDPEVPAELPGVRVAEYRVGPLTFRHEPRAGAQPGEIAGHLHPVAKVASDKGRRRARAFVTDIDRLVMPAFGAYAGGLNVLDAAFAPVFQDRPVTAHVCGTTRVFTVRQERLVHD